MTEHFVPNFSMTRSVMVTSYRSQSVRAADLDAKLYINDHSLSYGLIFRFVTESLDLDLLLYDSTSSLYHDSAVGASPYRIPARSSKSRLRTGNSVTPSTIGVYCVKTAALGVTNINLLVPDALSLIHTPWIDAAIDRRAPPGSKTLSHGRRLLSVTEHTWTN